MMDKRQVYGEAFSSICIFLGQYHEVLMTGTMEPFDDRPNGATLGSG
jgi:hypothetical protein